MLNLGFMNNIPSVKVLNQKFNNPNSKRKGKDAFKYDPETSAYRNKTEHDICTGIGRWDRV